MQKKDIAKAFGYVAGTAALVALFDVGFAYAEKDSKNRALYDLHIEMKNLQEAQHQNYVGGHFSETQRDTMEKRMTHLQAEHQQLEMPIETIFFGKRAYKCPICQEERD